MAGYTRQSVADIVANAVIKAAPVNAEYNALRDVFAFATGHKHDGSSTEGAYIPLIADVDALNKVVIDTTNNRIGFFVQVSTGTVEQLRIQDGAIVPITDDDVDLGASGSEFKDLYIDGIGYIDTLTVHENATIAGTLGVTGLSTLASVDINGGNIDATVIGAATPAAATVTTLVATTADINAGTVDAIVGGTTPAAGTFTALTADTADINGGTIDNAVIGGATPAAATVTSLVATTADINAGTVDATIGGTTPAAGTFTSIVATTADINAGTIDNTVIGGATPAAATVSSLVATTADINGGTIDGSTIAGGTLNNAQIGNATPSTVVGTTVTAPIAGAVTGNVTGNVSGDVTGDVTGDLTGNVTAGSGSSSFTNVTINGSLDMNSGTSATVTGLANPVQNSDAATKQYVDTVLAATIDSAPAALDTLNELAAALGDDANYAATTTTALATKLPKAGGTMTGAIAMGTNKVTGLGAPTAGTDATTKTYVDAGDALQVLKAGDTMSGVLAMGANKITGLADPTAAQDAVTKAYVDTTNASNTAAADSASNAATSESNAADSATDSANSATASGNSASAAATSLATFTGQYVSQSSAPSSPSTGDLWFDTSASIMKVYNGSGWVSAGSAVSGTNDSVQYTATANQTTFSATYDTGSVQVYLNGIRLTSTDYTATNSTSIVLGTGASAGDIVFIQAFGTFELGDHYNKTVSDARFLGLAGGALTGAVTTNSTFDGRNVSVDGTKLDTIPVISTASTASFIAKGTNGVTDGYIQLNCEVNSHGIKLKSPPHSAGANYTLVFPNDDGSNGQVLTSDGSGVMSWTTVDLTALSGASLTSGIIPTARINASSIANDLLDSQHYAAGSIDAEHLAADIIDGSKIADNAINSEHYTDGSIDTAHFAAGSVDAAAMGANSVDSSELVDGSVDRSHLAADIVDGTKIADDAVNSEHIADGAIDLAHMSSQSVDEDNLYVSNAGTDGQYLQKQSGNNGGLTWGTVDLTTLSGANLTSGIIPTARINASSIANDLLDSQHYAAGSIDREHLAADIIDGTKIADDAINSEHYVDGSILTVHLANTSVTTAKIAGDAIDGSKIADDAINSEHYVDGSIDNQHISGMAASKLTGALPAISGASLTNLPAPSLLATPLAVGSYMIAFYINNSSTARAAGHTVSGSDLKHKWNQPSTGNKVYPMGFDNATQANLSLFQSAGASGTWKVMHQMRAGVWTSYWSYPVVLCQRIS
jgi:hypothetical protein